MLTLYRKDGSCSIAAHMLLLELDIPFKSIPMKEGTNRLYEGADGTGLTREAFLNINPMEYVPALSIEGEATITELSAVLFYVSSLRPDRGMTGRSAKETARVLQWLSWLSTTLNQYGFAGYWRPSRMVGLDASEEAFEAVRSEGKQTILKGFRILESWLDGTGFAAGEHLTVVDFVLHTFWRWVGEKFNMSQWPRFRDVARDVERLTGARKALEVEGISLSFAE